MSIYGTGHSFAVEADDDELVFVHEQVVPSWITEPYDWLPPSRGGDIEGDGYARPRAVVFVLDGEPKGGPGYGGQQYHAPLLVMSGEDYERTTFRDVMRRLVDAIEARRT